MSDPSPQATVTTPKKPRFARSFWMLNTIEMWERLAFYNLRVMAPIYIMQADDIGGLHLTATNKGTIYAWWAIFQSLLPIITGGIADRFGYKKIMTLAIFLMMVGYLLIAFVRRDPPPGTTDLAVLAEYSTFNFWATFTSIMILASGTAFFKPSIQGSLAQNLTKENSSMGWGIFYWVVNLGALIGHFLPAILLTADHTRENWRNLFLCSAAFTALNFFFLFTFKDVPSGADKSESLFSVFKRTFINIAEPRLVCWLLIMSGFWLMMYQLWDLHPNFIKDWVDSRPLVNALQWLPPSILSQVTENTPRGTQIPQQVLLAVNSTCIIFGVLGMSWLTRKMRTLSAMLGGTLFAIVGILIAGLTMNVWFLILGIICFSLGEMTTGPKKNEYLGLIAPPGKKGLYLGYVNIPVGVGVFIGSKIAGYIYGNFGEKAVLAQKYLAQHALPATSKPWNGKLASLTEATGVDRTGAFAKLMEVQNLSADAATELLWNTYSPQYFVWLPFAAVGIVSAISLYIFGRMATRWADMNA